MKNKHIILVLVFAIVLVATYIIFTNYRDNKILSLASCLTEKKVVFYGAAWCTHCQDQKKLFGGALPKITYVECSAQETNPILQECIDKKISKYPTWLDESGKRLEGVMRLETLAREYNCTY